MKRDGRKLAHNTLEEMRIMAVHRMKEGAHPAQMAASFGMHRSWAYKCLAAVRGRGKSIRALRSTKGTGRPRSLTRSQERQVFHWVNGQRDAQAVEHWKQQTYPELAAQAKREKADILFWDESGFRADAVHGKTWASKGQTPVVQRPGQRQSINAASAVNANGAFWYATYQGALTGELFGDVLKSLMQGRQRPLKLVVDGLPAHKKQSSRKTCSAQRASSVCTSCQGTRQTSIRMSVCGVTPSARESHVPRSKRAKSVNAAWSLSCNKWHLTPRSSSHSSDTLLSPLFLTHE